MPVREEVREDLEGRRVEEARRLAREALELRARRAAHPRRSVMSCAIGEGVSGALRLKDL
jgi:hypothetical protein